ncbi:MAG: alpha-2-macroglobulin [Treponema sp.]|nr:alpha-2-macroglobulin [Treponema sp.]
MKKSIFAAGIGIFAAVLGLSSCGKAYPPPNPELVAAVSSGMLSADSTVKVVFNNMQDTSVPLSKGAFRLKPSVKGGVSWNGGYILTFTPSSPLKPGTRYQAVVSLEGIDPFKFEFKVQIPSIEVVLDPVRVNEEGEVVVAGTLTGAAGAPRSKLRRVIDSSELGRPEWTIEEGVYRFVFKPVRRQEAARTAEITWNGSSIGAKEKGFTTVQIPGTLNFEMVNLLQTPEYLEVSFSAPLRANQDLRGFISLSGNTNIRYSLEGNVVRIFGEPDREGIPEGSLLVIQDLEDVNGNVLVTPVQYIVAENWDLPEVRFTGSGNMLPTSQGSSMVVETRNVSGMFVEAFRIYGDNMLQFLQVNDLEGTYELGRVGEPVWTREFEFPWTGADKNRRVRRGLDLSALARKYPGEMFHLRISFRRRHVRYECTAGHEDFSTLEFPDDSFIPFTETYESSFWDYYGYNFNYDFNRYKKDPCHPAFYLPYSDHNITVGRNVLVSDLGLLAKKDLDGNWFFAASNVKTAKPSPDTDIDVFNFQGRRLARVRTGPDGFAALSLSQIDGTPSFLRAADSLGVSFLKINDSLALAVSHFDVSGDRPLSGQRGLIYGDRGVWRPGDDIYLTFLLSDPESKLPQDHPVSFELEDPRGRVTNQQVFTSSVDGFYAIAVSTKPDAPTGDWTARVKVGGLSFQKNLKIETVMPNRLRMNLDFGPLPYIDSGKKNVSLEAAWLYGAPAPGLKADVSVSFSDRETGFSSYTDYSFRDPSRTVSSERQIIYEGNLDKNGKSVIAMELNPGNSVPGKLNARFLTRVFEPSGVFSSEQTAMEFSPYKRYVGIKLPKGDASRNMLLTDTDHRADIALLDAEGKPVRGAVSLECAIYKLSWRWWWEKGTGEDAEFASVLSRSPLAKETVSAVDGRASWNFQVKYPDWGRYLVIARDLSGGHAGAEIVYIDWPGWAGRAQEGGQGASAMLVLSAEKTGYEAGEKVRVSFPSNRDAAALVAVEKGGRILREEWIACADTVTGYEFTADPSMVPNVYVHVTLLQPHLQTANDLPMRLYGIVPVMVEDPRTRINPRIEAAANWEPETAVSFTVSESSGRPMTYTAAVVDEGLLGLTRYTLPNPRNTFYAREASFLKSWDLYHDIMGAYAGQLETLLAIGGGDDVFNDGAKEIQRFKPVVRFFGPYELAAGQRKTETFILPPYIGSLRIMVMAASSTKEPPVPYKSGRAYGAAERPVTVSSDLMVFGTIPRTLSPGDETVIPVSVNSYTEGARQVRVSLAAEGAALAEDGVKTIAFDKPGEKMTEFRVTAPAVPGNVKISIKAESAGLKTANHVTDLQVRSTAIPVSKSVTGMVSAGESWEGTIAFPGKAGTNTGVFEFSRLPPLNLEGRLRYLVAYPHGCIEQTTSAAFPQLYLDKALNLDGVRLAEINTNIAAGIERLTAFQVPSGGFSYWPGDGGASEWGTTYAGHFLVEAKRAGYTVPPDLLSRWVRYQKDRAGLWQSRGGNQVEQAYRLYTLALAGEADLGSMNRLREQRELTLQAAWRLAAAYWYAGQRDTARAMVRSLDTRVGEYRELSGTFGSSLRDKAMILETLILLEDARGRGLFEEIAAALSEERWLSTQETAYALIAAVPYMRGAGNGPLALEASIAGRAGNVSFTAPLHQLDMGSLAGDSAPYRAVNRSSSPVYVRVTVRGLPEEGLEPAMADGLSLNVEYRDREGKQVNPSSAKTGDDMEVRVTVKNTALRKVSEIALVHPLPASWEIVNYRLGGDDSSAARFKYQDIRDDRIMTYFDLERGEEKTVVFMMNKAYGGSYFQPAVHAYAMYDESIRALVPGVRASGR